MATSKYSSKNANSFWRFSNWKAWLGVVIVLILAFPLFRYLKGQLQVNKEQNDKIVKDDALNDLINHPQTVQQKADKITGFGAGSRELQSDAKLLTHHLGTKYSDVAWWSFLTPSGWTENDAEAAKIVIHQRNNYALLKRLYFIYTNSRDLSYDLQKYLDDAELKQVNKYIKF